MYLIIHQKFRNITSLSYVITRVVALFAFLFSGYTEGNSVENPTGWTSSIVDTTFNKHTGRDISNALDKKGMKKNSNLDCIECSPPVVRPFTSNTTWIRNSKEITPFLHDVGAVYNNTFYSNDTNGANYETIY